jgi:hypothetical protein
MSAFMKPQYQKGVFWHVQNQHGEGTIVGGWLVGEAPAADDFRDCIEHGDPVSFEQVQGWFFRLSAPGYMDCTEWSGPYDTLKEARSELENLYQVDADTGELFDYEGED